MSKMHIARTIPELRAALEAYRRPAFVPTMGNLHEGHLALVTAGQGAGRRVRVASIFVNRLAVPAARGLRHLSAHLGIRLRQAGKRRAATCCSRPARAELYPQPQTYKVHPPAELADILEGHFRPGFFVGVCTVVMKLFAACSRASRCSARRTTSS